MSPITIDLAAARHALRALTPRTVTLLASIPDLDVPMWGSEWTVGQAAAHVLFGAEIYAEYAQGVERPTSIDRTNVAESHRRRLAALVTLGAPQMGAELHIGIDAFLHATEDRDAGDLLPWHQGRLPCATMTGLLMGEQLLHGYDIAQTLGAEWPIEPEPARLTLQALLDVLPAFVVSETAKGVDATYELTVDGGPQVVARFRDGALSLSAVDSEAVDCRLSGDPATWLLGLYGRAGWEQLLHSQRVTVTDGDAALGAGFKQLLRNP
ncbi:MAG: SCP2 sterol-binding domain-containing protein [Pseudonocardiaceae bacterium]